MREACRQNLQTTRLFLAAFQSGNLYAIERLLAPNFMDIRKPNIEMQRYAYLDALRILFENWTGCELTVNQLTAEGSAVALEFTVIIHLGEKNLMLNRHDLLLFEDGQLIAVHEYGEVR